MYLKGIYAPIVTPFHADESINHPSSNNSSNT